MYKEQKMQEHKERLIRNDPEAAEIIKGNWKLSETPGQKRAIRTKVQCAHKRNEQFEKKYEETRTERTQRLNQMQEFRQVIIKCQEENEKLHLQQYHNREFDTEIESIEKRRRLEEVKEARRLFNEERR
mmetsp:Transcript_11589/g.17538  ORF Transcript_11589/g.17538 Transcript_11589/m.17538 type:complete len:129 (+) Transcript_11589:738-1124(+)